MSDPTKPIGSDAPAAPLADLSPEERRLFQRFAAILAAEGPPALPVLRVERVEVVDRQGRTRIVIGDLGGHAPDTPGIGVYDRHHSQRVALALSDFGPWLNFSLGGDDALVLGVDDPETDSMRPGPYLGLIGPDGDVALGWRVNAESGAVESDGAHDTDKEASVDEPGS